MKRAREEQQPGKELWRWDVTNVSPLPQSTRAPAHVSIHQHTSAYVSIRQHTSAYVSIRQNTSRRSSRRASMKSARLRAALTVFVFLY